MDCPPCAHPLLPIVYGFQSAEAAKTARRGELILCGLTREFDEPSHRCRECGRYFHASRDGRWSEVRRVPHHGDLLEGSWKARYGKGWDWVEVSEQPRRGAEPSPETPLPGTTFRRQRP